MPRAAGKTKGTQLIINLRQYLGRLLAGPAPRPQRGLQAQALHHRLHPGVCTIRLVPRY
ncbi:MAG: hypothetical protein IT429_13850 [Gemmataceae bacterium]|nr:hypothetical protein [Gemmataceae bacterium]